ncbi:MAG: hypothetical protein A3F54_05520 [Candidatus Kerfeldbacteria bacterium RIFCSPHIGHO2_12_FULL_48_17]|uniref:isoleucine--tRNA ligase n=1 Tax=Candidatus Kerfeldbacteria bacterium RIFCSPHIGHO2_12_FULL_48_17 TaxID=1798542 RepID=A0A1G2B756_9BACT|nr:MAG: hypothetical protein A3F54_05520 [Candidatus Kerfeldbacteria bacterium RIFCSPHIGHO2_12_FULL_48_17]
MSQLNFPQLEEGVLKKWRAKNIFKKTLAKATPEGDFVFFEGPPTANGKPGIHHVIGRAYKDVIPRFKTMQGYRVVRKGGWDTHGLPVELQVEKALGISGKKQIETLKGAGKTFESIRHFNELCKKSVWEFKEEWEKLTERMGFWVDMEKPYITYDNDYIESVWWVLGEAWKKKIGGAVAGDTATAKGGKKSKKKDETRLLFQGHKVVPFCTRCGTALSSHELAQGYKTVKDNSVYIKFALQEDGEIAYKDEKTFILSWTTTPWTLPGNVALAVGTKMLYAKVKQNDEYYILSKNRLNILEGEYETIEEYTSSELIGRKYTPLFTVAGLQDQLKTGARAYEIVEADFVTDADGTGVVHTAVMYGEDDYNLGVKLGLPQFHTVEQDGRFVADITDVHGKPITTHVKSKDTDEKIIAVLQKHGNFYKEELYEHEYPFCWRCDTPLIYYARDSWFIGMSALKDELKVRNQTVNWIPANVKEGRFGEWLEGVKDWALSRDRYWGTPLPMWKCAETECGEFQFLDGGADLNAGLAAVKVALKKQGMPEDYHRPFIDEVEFACVACGGVSRRVPEVIDVWFDSGAMPFAQWHYPFENKALVDGGGASGEGGQAKGGAGAKPVQAQFPADYIAEAIDQTRGWFYTLLAVSTFLDRPAPYKNVICYAHVLDKKGKKMSKSKGNIVNPWDVIRDYGIDALRFHLFAMSQPGEPKRFDVLDVKKVVQQRWLILWNVLTFYKMFAGGSAAGEGAAAGDVQGKIGSHLMDAWLGARVHALRNQVTEDLEAFRITEATRALGEFITELSTWYIRRSRVRFKSDDAAVRGEAVATLKYALDMVARLLAPFTPFVADALYAELGGAKDSVHLEAWPKTGKVDAKILKDMDKARKIIEAGLSIREKAGIKIRQPLGKASVTDIDEAYLEIIGEELNIEVVKVRYIKGSDTDKLQSSEHGLIDIDLQMTPELEKKGLVRELTRTANAMRKKAGLTIQDVVIVEYATDDAVLRAAIEENKEMLAKATISKEWIEGAKDGEEVKVNGKGIKIDLIR